MLDKGFKFFLPRFVKEYNLELLRVSSIGYVNGYLSNNEYINKSNILNIGVADLTYYLTDYNEPNQRQLDYLIKDKIIPYSKSTSIIIEGHNIPPSVSNKLDKWFYFTFENSVDKQLKEMSYTFNMSFDKSQIDAYVKTNYKIDNYNKDKFVYIDTYLNNLTKEKPFYQVNNQIVSVISDTKIEKSKTSTKKESKYYLDIKKINSYINIEGIENTYKSLSKTLNTSSGKKNADEINFNLGMYYLKTNKKSNFGKALKYFENSGLKEAYFNLGIFYYIGLNVKEDDRKAYQYFKKSSDLGFLRANNNKNIMEKFRVGIR